MIYRVVTTVHAAGWEQFGRQMVESFLANWSPELQPLILYAEGFTPEPRSGLEVRRLPAWIDEFKDRYGAAPANRGKMQGGYDYRFDAIKFAHKVAALTDAGLSITDGMLIWIDADTVTHAPVDAAWLDSLFPGPGYIAWLDRNYTHIEAGFVMFRADHPYHLTFMERFRDIYASGEVFSLRETHDSYVLQHLGQAKHANGKIEAPASLSGWARRTSHPFVNGPLGERLDHKKGPRKEMARTPNRDLVQARPEAYWNAG